MRQAALDGLGAQRVVHRAVLVESHAGVLGDLDVAHDSSIRRICPERRSSGAVGRPPKYSSRYSTRFHPEGVIDAPESDQTVRLCSSWLGKDGIGNAMDLQR
ncbi:hypothetical protein NN3_62230 [Nocardia neocaledoniensis NBRC 108232]|nr:hypothetical protein NN3_62230 [Nocardia neocaledoniensis NBRC 108232]